MKTRLLVIALALMLITAACVGPAETASPSPSAPAEPTAQSPSPPAPESSVPALEAQFTVESYPRVDGSTANIPLGEALASLMLGIDRADAAKMIEFSGTTDAYQRLMYGNADLLLVYEASPVTIEQKNESNFEWDIAPIGRDALVFIVNKNNPVTNLTTDQARDIYTGKITNWNQLGGPDLKIEAFQRNKTSGSQTLFEKLVMRGETPMEPPTEYAVGEMDSLIKAVVNYNNSGAAIGYSVFYYAKNMNPGDGLRFMSIDGVEPTKESIRSGKYPHVNDFYAVIDKTAAGDSAQRQLYDWLQTEQGQKLVDAEGYVPLR